MPQLPAEEIPSRRRDDLEDVLALLHDAQQIISLHAKRADRNARSRERMTQVRATERTPNYDDAA